MWYCEKSPYAKRACESGKRMPRSRGTTADNRADAALINARITNVKMNAIIGNCIWRRLEKLLSNWKLLSKLQNLSADILQNCETNVSL